MRSLVLAIAVLWAATARAPWPLAGYFKAQLVGVCALETALLTIPTDSPLYATLFIGTMALILGFVCCIAWESIEECGKWVRRIALAEGTFFGLLFSALTVYGIWHDYRTVVEFLWLPIVQSSFLTAAGVVMAATVPFSRGQKRIVAATLAILWLAQAGFGFLFALYVQHSPLWLQLNNWAPTMLVVPALCWLGWKLRETQPPIRPLSIPPADISHAPHW